MEATKIAVRGHLHVDLSANRTCMKERQKRHYLENRGKAKKNDPHAPVSMVSIICDICGKKVTESN